MYRKPKKLRKRLINTSATQMRQDKPVREKYVICVPLLGWLQVGHATHPPKAHTRAKQSPATAHKIKMTCCKYSTSISEQKDSAINK
jgi:hypothetical protein